METVNKKGIVITSEEVKDYLVNNYKGKNRKFVDEEGCIDCFCIDVFDCEEYNGNEVFLWNDISDCISEFDFWIEMD